MNKTGAELAVFALEQIGVKYTFGIPGVHNIELYDALNSSKQIKPLLVTHEGGASFMALGVSCTSNSIGTLVVVPAAGTTHAMSGIGEAYLDGIPMLIISGGTRIDTGKYYQLHQLDQGRLVQEITKDFFKVTAHKDVIPTIYKAYKTAVSGEPGPVFIEIPIEIQMFKGPVDDMPDFHPGKEKHTFDPDLVKEVARLLTGAKHPGIFVGWGASGATEELVKIAERIGAPVSTTLQGKASFPHGHPLHTGFGFGPNAVPASQKAFKDCDVMLAVGVRFSEIATGSYGVTVPENLIHIDINPDVFNKNYPAKVQIEGDAKTILNALFHEIASFKVKKDASSLKQIIRKEKEAYRKEWMKDRSREKVSPGFFFNSIQNFTDDDTLFIVDDGKHTYLAAELLQVNKPRHFISPTDFNAMGFCAPAAIGAQLMNPGKQVVGIVGDGGFMMTGMELLTATTNKLNPVYFIFHDGELGQISQFQKVPLKRKVATIIGNINFKGMAEATGAAYFTMVNDFEIDEVMKLAFEAAKQNRPVIVDVNINYSKKTYMTKGVIKTNLKRLSFNEKTRIIGRAVKRHLFDS